MYVTAFTFTFWWYTSYSVTELNQGMLVFPDYWSIGQNINFVPVPLREEKEKKWDSDNTETSATSLLEKIKTLGQSSTAPRLQFKFDSILSHLG